MIEYLSPSAKALKSDESEPTRYATELIGCPVDRSFTIPTTEIKVTSLRPIVYRYAQVSKKKFKVLEHKDLGLYEIFRYE